MGLLLCSFCEEYDLEVWHLLGLAEIQFKSS